MSNICPGTGRETHWNPDATLAQCPQCGHIVPIDSDHKRSWFKSHDITSDPVETHALDYFERMMKNA